ncbi:helix-turn-helix domain-containing protein [Lactococcus sp. S64]|uniref:helix-turn-helix domain-containing protein n=1 Tax=Lactococcus sp. S64 TaxID=2767459 RepID=UPI00351ABF96
MAEETIFYIRLKEQIKIRKTSFNQVERDLGYPRNSLNNYKNGTEPSGNRLVELAEYFMVSPRFLIGKEEEGQEQSFKEFFKN